MDNSCQFTIPIRSKKADALVTDLTYNIDVIMEASGGPLQQDRKHTLEDSKKNIQYILITSTLARVLRPQRIENITVYKLLVCELITFVALALVEDQITLIEVSLYKPRICKKVEDTSAVFPFALSFIGEYMRVFELISFYAVSYWFCNITISKQIINFVHILDGLLKHQEVMQELSKVNSWVKGKVRELVNKTE